MPLNIVEIVTNVTKGTPKLGETVQELSLEIPFDLDLTAAPVVLDNESANMPDDEPLPLPNSVESLLMQRPKHQIVQPMSPSDEAVKEDVSAPLHKTISFAYIGHEGKTAPLKAEGLALPVDAPSPAPQMAVAVKSQSATERGGIATELPLKHNVSEHIAAPSYSTAVKPAAAEHTFKSAPFPDANSTPRSDESVVSNTDDKQVPQSKNLVTEKSADFIYATLPKPSGPSSASNFSGDAMTMSLLEPQELQTPRRLQATLFQSAQTSQPVKITPQMIAAQIFTSVSGASSDKIEIRLDPPELGRLLVTITQSENGMATHVVAEKPDIAEFLRRNSDILSRELEKSGFEGSTLEFSQEDNQQSNDENGLGKPANSNELAMSEATIPHNLHITYILHGGLDIRL